MAIIASAGEAGSRTPAPEGAHQAVCVDVIDRGMIVSAFKDDKTGQPKVQHKIDIAWEIDEPRDDGKRFVVYKRYTLSLHEKAMLRHDLESWRGKPFTFDELAGFDVERLMGANAIINVQHKPSADGTRTYANVVSVMPLMKGMPKIAKKDYTRKPEPSPQQEPPPISDEELDAPITDDSDVPF